VGDIFFRTIESEEKQSYTQFDPTLFDREKKRGILDREAKDLEFTPFVTFLTRI
jgi:hypothetical protein